MFVMAKLSWSEAWGPAYLGRIFAWD